MLQYLKDVIFDPKLKSPSTYRFVSVLSACSLALGFLFSTFGLVLGNAVPEGVVLGLGGILATLAGTQYAVSKYSKGDQK